MLIDQAESSEQIVLSSPQAGKRLGLSEAKMRQMRLDGTGPAFRVLTSNRVCYTPADLADWVANKPRVMTTAEAEKVRATIDKARKEAFSPPVAA